MRPRISIRRFVRPSVRSSRVFLNEPIMDENSRKWLGKQSKWSKLVKKSSEWSQNVAKCPTMSQVVQKCPKMPTPDASLSERTCFYDFCVWLLLPNPQYNETAARSEVNDRHHRPPEGSPTTYWKWDLAKTKSSVGRFLNKIDFFIKILMVVVIICVFWHFY